MGSYNGSRDADLDYPLAFLQSMERMLRTKPARPPFRHVHLGGMFTCKDQDAKLWLLEGPRKLRGLAEARVIEFAGAHDSTWRAFVIRPGGVATERMTGSRTAVALMGQNWGIRVEELGAFMTYLVVDGAEEDSLIEHLRIVEKGKELRRLQKGTGAR
ncbi:putative nucleoside-diphosphate-sugar epimerase, putative [Rosellinia necatrix]|uniref:Putative nucleoside-diphosphate-sugar epimerase, putative n=1 Tax=Rosellinia necatrix TaxID=77044 RepID=A0A1S8A9W0_ROSNE|nr:putative nucleoside-diphosphate-sugar epimerase, putative [Rosellinia necatrix]